MSGKDQQFDFETMAVVLYAMLESGVTLGSKHYDMMSAVSGDRGSAAFNHQFRKVKARAKELHDRAKKDETSAPVKKGKTNGAVGKAVGGEKQVTKRGRKAKNETMDAEDADDEPATKKLKIGPEVDGDEADGEGSDEMFGAVLQ